MTDPIRPTDDTARELARRLLAEARTAALGVIAGGEPLVTRIAFALGPDRLPLTLVSALSAHTAPLHGDGRASLLLGDPPARGDPLAGPRLTLQATARPLPREDRRHGELRAAWLDCHPKAALYIDFADFGFVAFDVRAGLLNGGFGRAYRLTPADMGLPAA